MLRRYARAVSGSQKRGDEWVRLCAEIAVRQPELIAHAENTKQGVFALFHRLQQPFGDLEAGTTTTNNVSGRLKESLTDMAPLQRQVLLLTVLEGFSLGEAAHIIGIEIVSAERNLEEARRELQRVAAVRVLVIEDETLVALDIANIVRKAGHEIVGIAATENLAVELAKKHSPHLILADVQLLDSGSGIAAVNEIMRTMTAPVIFVTGFPERLLTGKVIEPAFIISKPFDSDVLRAAIAQALDTVSI